MEFTSGRTPGPRLADHLAALANNVHGALLDAPELHVLAERFVRTGWWARTSSWTGFEVGCAWATIELFVHSGETLFAGIVDPQQFSVLERVFHELGVDCVLDRD